MENEEPCKACEQNANTIKFATEIITTIESITKTMKKENIELKAQCDALKERIKLVMEICNNSEMEETVNFYQPRDYSHAFRMRGPDGQ